LLADRDLFSEICNLPYFQRTHIILFFSKKDLFQEKIKAGVDPRVTCPLFWDYNGPLEENPIIDFIVDHFAQCNAEQERKIYCHITSASNPDNIQQLFDVVYDLLLDEALDGVRVSLPSPEKK
jgi:guanine nucleotide-binding protein G(i) subunit alpha